MLTPFGREVRKLRIDHAMKMKDLATKLDVTSAFLSAVETGRKSIPGGWLESISHHMKLDANERVRLEKAISETARNVSIALEGQTGRSRELATAFARRFPTLTEQEINKMFEVLTTVKRGKS